MQDFRFEVRVMEGTCIIIGGGDFYGLHTVPKDEDYIIAADSGYAYCEKEHLRPDLVVGDFDSLGFVPDFPDIVQMPVEKDDTDTLHAIRIGLAKGYRRFAIYGGTGGKRADHTLANIQCLLFLHRHDARGVIFGKDIVFRGIFNETISFSTDAKGDLSVFCLDGEAHGVTIQGMKYELTDATLTSDFPLGCSNSFLGTASSITVNNGSLILVYSIDTESEVL